MGVCPATDAATDSLGQFGSIGNLTVLAVMLGLYAWEVLFLRPRREKEQREHLERLQDKFIGECHAARTDHREQIAQLRSEWSIQRQEQNRLQERNSDAVSSLAVAVQTLSTKFDTIHA